MKCPDCNGKGCLVAAHVRYADGTGRFNMEIGCTRCNKTGTVPDEMAGWIEAGRRMRHQRVHVNRRNLRDEAKRLGIDVVTLSKMEAGKIEPIGECEP